LRRGLASEELARLVLESMGYTVKKMRHKVVIEGAEVAELDMVAVSPEGEEYGVEVKSGEISVSDVRQAYVSAKLANLRPMIVGRRLSSEAPQRLAQELGVKVVLLPEYVMLEPHELYDVVRRAVVDALAELLVPPGGLSEGELRALRALAASASLGEFARRMGVSEREAGAMLGELRRRGLLPASLRGYRAMRLRAVLVLLVHQVTEGLRGEGS